MGWCQQTPRLLSKLSPNYYLAMGWCQQTPWLLSKQSPNYSYEIPACAGMTELWLALLNLVPFGAAHVLRSFANVGL